MKQLLIVLLTLISLQPAIAAATQPSEASLRELLAVMESKKLIDETMGQVDAMMQTTMQQALSGQKATPDQQKIMDESRAKMNALFKEEMKWEILEPMFIDIYQKSFTQQEVDAMVEFYKSDPGQSIIAKMPVVMQHTMKAMQGRMSEMMPKIQQLQQDSLTQLRETRKK